MSFSIRVRSASFNTARVRQVVAKDPRVTRYLYKKGNQVERVSKRFVGVRTGRLKRSIHTDIVRYRGLPKARVGSSVNYAFVHHEGARPHTIKGKRGGTLVFMGKTGVVHTKVVKHPGSKPTKYLTRALRLVAGI